MQVSLTLLFTATMYAITTSAGVTENFNSRSGIPINNIKASLQNSCWTFHHFDVNNHGWNPNIEGDGAMVADAEAIQHGNASILTPILKITDELTISFDYLFNKDFAPANTRWIKVCLADESNNVIKTLETINIVGVNVTKSKKFETTYNNIAPGEYRLLLQYGGTGGNAIIAIDELKTSAPFKYESGCNTSPVASRDIFTGMPNRTASGSLLDNDKDNNGQSLTAYLIKNSADGNVVLAEDGTFTFTPHKNFKGPSTTFVYKVCDAANLCSPNATVVINFPSSGLTEFKGSYQYDGNVEISWNTQAGITDIKKFELERSVDGREWKNSTTVFAKNGTHSDAAYTYIDKVGKNTALKRDLYYRLKQVNTDGSTTTSKLMIVRVYNSKNVSTISVTPNPAKSDIAVNLQLHENSMASFRILTNTGATVFHKIADIEHGTNNILLEGSSKLKPGMYNLEVVVNSKERMLVKLIKE